MGRTCQMNFHDFYCLNCGQKSMTLPRKKGWQHGAMHRKKLYCPWCHDEYNCVETKDLEQEWQFKQDFEEGVYKNEQADSLAASRYPCVG